MEIKKIKLKNCSLNLGELHKAKEVGYYNPEFHCVTETGEEFKAFMKLHITEPLNKLIIADPRNYLDGGIEVNSVNSYLIRRRNSYKNESVLSKPVINEALLKNVNLYEIDEDEIKRCVLENYNIDNELAALANGNNAISEIAFTCHDPNAIGGGNTIMFRLINWLADLGIKVTVYSCGMPPSWLNVRARFKCFSEYKEMFEAITEKVVIIYSMWHIEPMLKTNTKGKLIYHLRQIYEPCHYGVDYESMIAEKPVIKLLESLPIGSIAIAPHLEEWYRLKNNINSLLITNGINLREFFPLKKKKTNPKIKTIVNVGSPFHFVKGASVLLAALNILAKKNPGIKFKWKLASGEKSNITIDPKLFQNNVEFERLGGLDRTGMRELYNNADLVVNPSLYEGFGLPTLEAMACGVPVVHADNRGLDFIIENNKDCLIVPVNDPVSLAGAMEKMFSNEELAKNLSAEGLATVAKYSLANQFNMFVDVFSKILNNKFDHKKVDNIAQKLNKDIESFIKGGFISNQNKMPLVSVVIPAYNQAEYLKQALNSLIDQTYQNWEAVVVNDGSTDNTKEVMDFYAAKDLRIRPFSKPNGGITSALNEGVERCRGEFFCWLSSDDLFYPEKIQAQVDAFNTLGEDYALVYGSFDLLQEETPKLDIQPFAEPIIPGSEFPEALKFDFIDGCTIMIRMEVMREVGAFNPFYRHSQDMELWIRIASRGYRFYLLNKKLTIRRIHFAQSSTGNMIHCRYDAAWMINYYLEHFSLLEMYRYFDLNSQKDIPLFLMHLTGRVMNTEANVNHPLIQEKFWRWIVEGLSTLESGKRNAILKNILVYLLNNRNVTYKIDYYLGECLKELAAGYERKKIETEYSISRRDIRYNNRETDPFGQVLFDYGTDLLINSHTPLFAQELYFHNTNKVVDTPYKLAHSVFRYLSQFPNKFRDLVKPISDISQIPQTETEATKLFCILRYNEFYRSFLCSLEFSEDSGNDYQEINEAENVISNLPSTQKEDLDIVCSKNPTSTILYYWRALTFANEGKYKEALEEGKRTLTYNHFSYNRKIASNLALWAEKSGNLEDAYIFYTIGYSYKKSDVIKKLKAYEKHYKKQISNSLAKFFGTKRMPNDPPDAKLIDFRAFPLLNGNYIINASCKTEDNKTFSVNGTFPYTEKFEPLKITEPFTKKDYLLTDSIIHKFLTDGYYLPDAIEAFHKKILTGFHKPSIAFTIPESSIMSGGAIIAYRYANWLSELGVETAIYSNDKPPDWLNIKVKFYQIIDETQRFRSITEQIIIVFSVLELQTLLRNMNSKDKIIYHLAQVIEEFHYHGPGFESIIKPKGIFEILHRLPVGRIAVSRHIYNYLEDHYGQNSEFILNGIDLNIFKARWEKIISENVTVMTVGNPFRLLKGIADIKKALTILSKKNPALHIHLVVASGQKMNLDFATDQVIQGYTTTMLSGLSTAEMGELYKEADVYVNGSWYEGFGLPSVEAMAVGVPVVQADNLGLDGIVKDCENCLIVPPADPLKIAEAIDRLIRDGELRKKIIKNGIKTASEFSLGNQYQMFIETFEKILFCRFDRYIIEQKKKEFVNGTVNDLLKTSSRVLRPQVSVIIPFHNQFTELLKSIESILSQNYDNWEAIIVNYDPTDESVLFLEQFRIRDRRIKLYFNNSKNFTTACNEGLIKCSGEWISFLKPGDIYNTSRFTSIVSVAELSPDTKFFYSHYAILDSDNKLIEEKDSLYYKQLPGKENLFLGLIEKNFIYSSTVAIHHSIFNEIGFMNEDIIHLPEYELWLRIAVKFEMVYINAKTCAGKAPSALNLGSYSADELLDYGKIFDKFFVNKNLKEILRFYKLDGKNGFKDAVINVLRVITNKNSLISKSNSVNAFMNIFNSWFNELDESLKLSLDPRVIKFIASYNSISSEKKINVNISVNPVLVQ